MLNVSMNFACPDSIDFFSTSSLNDFFQMLKKYPKATDESNDILLKKYRAGDREAGELLIKTNLRLVVSQAKHHKTHSYEMLDVIQEGIIGFLSAMDSYDETRGEAKFSTFAVTCIRNAINGALYKNDNLIRRPSYIASAVNSYQRIIATCDESPCDTELRKVLNISPAGLERVKDDYKLNALSLNHVIGDEEEKEFGDLIPSQEEGFGKILDEMVIKDFLLYLKLNELSPYYYYVLYNRLFKRESVKTSTLASELCLSESQISAIGRKALSKVKDLILRDGGLSVELADEYKRNVNHFSVKPISPDSIVRYLFFRDLLEEEERALYKLLITSSYSFKSPLLAEQLDVSIDSYWEIYESLKRKVQIDDKVKEVYGQFKAFLMKQYGSGIYDIDLNIDLSNIPTNVQYVATMWEGVSYSEVMAILHQNDAPVPDYMWDLIERYFDGERDKFTHSSVSNRNAEREINSILFGFHKRSELSISGLKEVLIKNKNEFSQREYQFLMSHKFNQGKLNTRFYCDMGYLSRRLESMYFDFTNYREYNFTKEKYESVRDKCTKKLSPLKIQLLDMYYGVKSPKYSIQQIATFLKVSYEEAKSNIYEARNNALSVYLGRTNTKMIDESIYAPYILDDSIDLCEDIRIMLMEFVIKKKSYDEIAKIHGVSNRKVSKNITSGLLTIDFYRFGIRKARAKYTFEEFQRVLSESSLTEKEREIIQMKLDGKTREEMMAATKFGFQKVAYILNKFYSLCDRNRVESIQISEEDIKKEVTAHISEMVLNQKERLLLAKLYGIVCDVNPTGKVYTEQEFRIAHPDMSKNYNKILRDALYTVRSKKAGFTRASLAYMSRSDLKFSLMDPRIPISEKERKILYYSFELNGYPYKTLKELEDIIGDKAASLKDRVERTFATIYKYENDEIPASISFEYDVNPYLRFFSKSDQSILRDLYQHKLTYEEMAKQHNLTKSQIEVLTVRLDSHLRDLIDEKAKGFDFDYFWSAIDDDDVPYYGDKEKAKRVFYLYYEERMSASEIISHLGLNCAESVVNRTITQLMIAVAKRREGITKVKCYTPEEIADYYMRNQNAMDNDSKKMYSDYFARVRKEREESNLSNITQSHVPSGILLDLIEDNHENVFSFKETSKEEALAIIRKYKNKLSRPTINSVLRVYHISQREMMSGSEQMKVLRFLAQLEIHQKVLLLKMAA